MNSLPISTFLWAWFRRQVRMKINTFGFVFKRPKPGDPPPPVRSGALGKIRGLPILAPLMITLYFFMAWNQANMTAGNLVKILPREAPNGKIEVPRWAFSRLHSLEESVKIVTHSTDQSFSLVDYRRQYLLEKDKISMEDCVVIDDNDDGIRDPIPANRRISLLNQLRREKVTSDDANHIIDLYTQKGLEPFVEAPHRVLYNAEFKGGQIPAFLHWTTLYFLIALLGLTFMEGTGSSNPLVQIPELELESLAVFPVKSSLLFWLPLLQRWFLGILGWLVIGPPVLVMLMSLGHELLPSLGWAALVAFVFNAGLASCQVLYQYAGRFSGRPGLMRVAGWMQFPGYLLFCLMMMGGMLSIVLNFLQPLAMSDFIAGLSFFNPVDAIHQGSPLRLVFTLLLPLTLPLLAIGLLSSFSRGGLPSPQNDCGERKKAGGHSHLSPLALRLLRDRGYLIGTLVMPLVMLGFYTLQMLDHGSTISGGKAMALIFGGCAFMVMSALSNLAIYEGPSLWMLFSASRPVEQILKGRVIFWIKVSSAFAGLGVCVLIGLKVPDLELSRLLALFLGLPSICFIAAALSFSAHPPQQGSLPAKPKASYIYLFMMLTAMYGQLALAGLPGAQYSAPVLYGLLAFALWRDFARQLPYYLDPSREAPGELTLKNAMFWCMGFLWIQSLVAVFCVLGNKGKIDLSLMALSYGVAAVVTTSFAAWFYRNKLRHSIPEPPQGRLNALQQVGALIALLAVTIGIAAAYLQLLKLFPIDTGPQMTMDDKFWFFILAVGLAPPLEEFLFRRLLLTALLRDLSPRLALFSGALIFAAIHPLASFPAVFCLGLASCWLYWRSGRLWLCMLLHAGYNAAVVAMS